jgi:hypothetical protein
MFVEFQRLRLETGIPSRISVYRTEALASAWDGIWLKRFPKDIPAEKKSPRECLLTDKHNSDAKAKCNY